MDFDADKDEKITKEEAKTHNMGHLITQCLGSDCYEGPDIHERRLDDGDIVLMQYVNTVENGETAAIWLKDEKETTLKKFYAEAGRVRLQPANDQMAPIYTNPDNVEIQGRVIAVIRQLE